jgi:hypothetical protein
MTKHYLENRIELSLHMVNWPAFLGLTHILMSYHVILHVDMIGVGLKR